MRKEIKKRALEEPKGTLVKALCTIALVFSILEFFFVCLFDTIGYTYENSLINLISSLGVFILTMPLILNFFDMILNSCRDNIVVFSDLFKNVKRSFKYIVIFSIVYLTYQVLLIVLSYIPVIGFILKIVLSILVIPVFIYMPFIYLDNKDDSIKNTIIKSLDILKNKKEQFYGMLISFVPLIILGIFTLGILYIWLIPYMMISFGYLYLNKIELKKERQISDRMVIIVFLIVTVVSTLLLFIFVPSSTNYLKSALKLGNTTPLKYGSTSIYFKPPKDYEIVYETDYSKTYSNGEYIVQYAIYLSDIKDVIKMDKEAIEELKENGYETSVYSFNVKVDNKKVVCYKYVYEKDDNKKENIVAYYEKENFVIAISITADKLSKNDIKQFINIGD